jgi:hypothetical protein
VPTREQIDTKIDELGPVASEAARRIVATVEKEVAEALKASAPPLGDPAEHEVWMLLYAIAFRWWFWRALQEEAANRALELRRRMLAQVQHHTTPE